jgi:hypothetical protein
MTTEPTPLRHKRLANRCPDAESLESMATSMTEIAASLKKIEPAADVLTELGEQAVKLRDFIKKWGPWALGSTPIIITAINAVSPEVGAILKAVVAAFAPAG